MLFRSICLECVLDFQGNWETYLPLVEFVYNNSYHSSIRMAPFETLYGTPHRSPLYWAKVGDGKLLGPELVRETNEKINVVRENMQAAQSRQKSYADQRQTDLEFQVSDHVHLKMSHIRGLKGLGRREESFHLAILDHSRYWSA